MIFRYVLRRLASILLVTLAILYFTALALTFRARSGLVQLSAGSLKALLQGAGGMTLDFFKGLWAGDLGALPNFYGDLPVLDILWISFANSLGLLFLALILAGGLGLLLGIAAALTKQRRRRYSFLFFSFLGVSAPSFLLAVVFQQVGITYTRTFGRRLVSMGGYAWDWDHLALPVLVLMARPVAYVARATYVSLLDVMREDYIRTAFAKGFSQRRTVITHALRNLAIPVLTSMALSLRFSLSALPIVENIFAWPGMGRRVLEGLNENVPMLVLAIALLIGLLLQVVNLLLDASYPLIDPRIREER